MKRIEKIYEELNKLNIDKKTLGYVLSNYLNDFDFLNKKFLDSYVKNENILSFIILKVIYVCFQHNYDKQYILKIIDNNIYGLFDDKQKLLDVKLKLNTLIKKFIGTNVSFKNFYLIDDVNIEEKFKNYFDIILLSAPFKVEYGKFEKSFILNYFNKIVGIKKNYLFVFFPSKLIRNNPEIFVNDYLKDVYFDVATIKKSNLSVLVYNDKNNSKLGCYYKEDFKKVKKEDIQFFSQNFIFVEEKNVGEIFKIKKYFTTGCNKCFYVKKMYSGKFKKFTQMAIVGNKEVPILFPYELNLRWKKIYKFFDEYELKSFAYPVYNHLLKYKDELNKRKLNSNLWFEYNSVKLDNFLKPMIIVSYKVRKKEDLVVRKLNGYDKDKKYFCVPLNYTMIIANDEVAKYFIERLDIEKIKRIINDEYLIIDNQGYYRFDVEKFKKIKLKDILN